jgi:hypothetical protein
MSPVAAAVLAAVVAMVAAVAPNQRAVAKKEQAAPTQAVYPQHTACACGSIHPGSGETWCILETCTPMQSPSSAWRLKTSSSRMLTGRSHPTACYRPHSAT